MAQVSWSLTALDNVQVIATHIQHDSPVYAAVFVQRVFAAARSLELFPNIGRVVPEYDDKALRELLFQGYRIVYGVEGEAVRILLVIHAARNLGARLPDEPWHLR